MTDGRVILGRVLDDNAVELRLQTEAGALVLPRASVAGIESDTASTPVPSDRAQASSSVVAPPPQAEPSSLQVPPDEEERVVKEAGSLADHQNHQAAIRLLQEAVVKYPGMYQARATLVEMLEKHGRSNEALLLKLEQVALFPDRTYMAQRDPLFEASMTKAWQAFNSAKGEREALVMLAMAASLWGSTDATRPELGSWKQRWAPGLRQLLVNFRIDTIDVNAPQHPLVCASMLYCVSQLPSEKQGLAKVALNHLVQIPSERLFTEALARPADWKELSRLAAYRLLSHLTSSQHGNPAYNIQAAERLASLTTTIRQPSLHDPYAAFSIHTTPAETVQWMAAPPQYKLDYMLRLYSQSPVFGKHPIVDYCITELGRIAPQAESLRTIVCPRIARQLQAAKATLDADKSDAAMQAQIVEMLQAAQRIQCDPQLVAALNELHSAVETEVVTKTKIVDCRKAIDGASSLDALFAVIPLIDETLSAGKATRAFQHGGSLQSDLFSKATTFVSEQSSKAEIDDLLVLASQLDKAAVQNGKSLWTRPGFERLKRVVSTKAGESAVSATKTYVSAQGDYHELTQTWDMASGTQPTEMGKVESADFGNSSVAIQIPEDGINGTVCHVDIVMTWTTPQGETFEDQAVRFSLVLRDKKWKVNNLSLSPARP